MGLTRWGIIGPGQIAHNFADGLREATSGKLVAIASRDAGRRQKFGDQYGIAVDKRYSTYDAIVADLEVDAIYISTLNPSHAEISVMALRHGKAVVCEKPAGMNAGEVTAVVEVAAQEKRFFMEAFMYRCHPQIARLVQIIKSGEIGDVHHIKATFGFSSKRNPSSRLYDPALGGGGILDIGCYPVSAARLVAGAAMGRDFDNPISVKAVGTIGPTGVDEIAYGVLKFSSGIIAEIAGSVTREMENAVVVTGARGTIKLPTPWTPGRNAGPSDATIEVTIDGKTRVEEIRSHHHLFAFEAELASTAIAEGKLQAVGPAMTHLDSIGNAETLDRWRQEVGYVPLAEKASHNRKLALLIPSGAPQIPHAKLEGVALPVSRLILGADNKNDLASGAIVWDAFLDAGGNTFDTGFVYGGGHHETVLGQWISARKVAKDINVIVKGAHTPYCTPRAIAAQLEISLDRLGLDNAPIYIMHRDNPQVPVGEFVEALNALHAAGKIGAFGGSNWSPARFAEGQAYAVKRQLKPMAILNNNLSLAVMEKPVWDGCVTSNTQDSLKFLRDNRIAHISWSSQARGYFLPVELRDRLPADIGPEVCYGSPANEERRRRAELLAKKHGVSTHNIATAWVLAQKFPSFAIIGPRSPGEIVSTLPTLTVNLTEADVAWLNLES
ncbi:MAG: aldo/keto reductase [Aestuariivirga sp.]|jgi:predicted dehydrogenase/aryl-alcohol dehydrogenase-like predicted oxidoreductase